MLALVLLIPFGGGWLILVYCYTWILEKTSPEWNINANKPACPVVGNTAVVVIFAGFLLLFKGCYDAGSDTFLSWMK